MIRFAKVLLVSALMISIGAQWVVLQSAAWLGMAVSYSIEAGSVSAGLSNTFDGEHPCKLCRVVKKGTESGTKDTKLEAVKKIELFVDSEIVTVRARTPEKELFKMANESAEPVHHAPPVPPPRCGQA